MPEIALINETEPTAFICPECGVVRNAGLTQFKLLDQIIKLKCKCPCGNTYATTLERRKSFRKEVSFKGCYEYPPQEEQGTITVENVSMGGIKFKMGVKGSFCAGHRLWVEFCLDDGRQTLIRRQVDVRWMKEFTVGARFINTDRYDGLGLYVLS